MSYNFQCPASGGSATLPPSQGDKRTDAGKTFMEYYYGQAWVMGKSMDIRVKPEMIKDGIVEEIELYLLVEVSEVFSPVKTYDWHKKRSAQDTPGCREIWVEINGVKKSLKFKY